MSQRAMAPSSINALVRWLLNPSCAACQGHLARPLDSPVCGACWRGVCHITPPYCLVCGDALPSAEVDTVCRRCATTPPHVSTARSAAAYEGSMREIMHAFKYAGRRPLARPLAQLMLDVGGDLLADADAVVPVPLHPWRALVRGFNQADDLAGYLRAPVWRVLRRRRHGAPQVGRSRSDRQEGVRTAFCLSRRAAFGWKRRSLAGATVVLIDDVMTTGATLEACGAVLLDAGVRTVRALTVARAVAARQPPPQPPHRLSSAPRR